MSVNRVLKRGLDVIGAGTALLLFSPLLAVIGLGVRRSVGRPVMFRQTRPGLGGVPFEMVKFRTMADTCDGAGNPLPDEARLTRFGRFLRKTSFDELPELWNVLKGDMSLVGPRPLLTQYLTRYTPEQARRHEVKPGLTGWAQINGRNAISWERKFELDVWYVDHQSLALDLRIIFLTIWKTLKREGISASSHATMPEFTGSVESVETE
jgi:sugar transferase EpsL